jgi:hypothetical protein
VNLKLVDVPGDEGEGEAQLAFQDIEPEVLQL